jgi:hypothetical protein
MNRDTGESIPKIMASGTGRPSPCFQRAQTTGTPSKTHTFCAHILASAPKDQKKKQILGSNLCALVNTMTRLQNVLPEYATHILAESFPANAVHKCTRNRAEKEHHKLNKCLHASQKTISTKISIQQYLHLQ